MPKKSGQRKLITDLPVTAEADTLIQAIREHQVVLIAGETGSGKTTQLPACHDGGAWRHIKLVTRSRAGLLPR